MGLGSRAKCFQPLRVMLRPPQSCSITPFWGECKSSMVVPIEHSTPKFDTLGGQGFRLSAPHKQGPKRTSPVNLREKSKFEARASHHFNAFFSLRGQVFIRDDLKCDADERPCLKHSRECFSLQLRLIEVREARLGNRRCQIRNHGLWASISSHELDLNIQA
jgi:hypothetical protein